VADYARHLAAAREAAGVDPGEAAAALGISFESYADLESYDDEILTAVSYREVVALSDLLGFDLQSFFGGSGRHRRFDELSEELRVRLAEQPLADLEEEVGWELGAQLETPERFADLPLDALADIAGAVGADWREFLPPRQTAT
jgi:transcriptional regulator with XRE-family HTH domain